MTSARPYKGLEPYDWADRDNFFGREQEKQILLGKILSHPLTLLYAATGVGKSSLLGAAVIPELEDLHHDNLDVAYHRRWIDEPGAAIKHTVRQTLRRRKKIAEADLPQLNGVSLAAFFQQCAAYSSEPLILVLDQFEELFRYHAGLSNFPSFIDALAQVMTDHRLPLSVVIAMREDFLAELSVFRGRVPELYNNYYRLQKLTLQQARQAIVQPVQRPEVGFQYEPDLLDPLINDLAAREADARQRPDMPQQSFASIEGPYLQIVCQALWEHDQDNPDHLIRTSTYDRLGGARAIVKRYFEQVMGTCSRAERRLGSRAFSFLVTEAGTKMAYPEAVLARILKVRRPKLQPVLRKLKAARILRDEQRPEGTWYELYHDAFAPMIDEWNQAFQSRRRTTVRWSLSAIIGVLLLVLGLGGYRQYQQQLRLSGNLGTLQIHNLVGAQLTLTCVRHYEDGSCAAEAIPLQGQSITLAGPADYMVTARYKAWTVRYPVYIHDLKHQLPLTVTLSPADFPEGMGYIPGGVFRMGDKDDKDGLGGGDERPHHDVLVDGFFMDEHEVTNAQYQQCVAAGACSAPHYEDESCYRWTEQDEGELGKVAQTFQEDEKPVVCVDWQEAKTYCEHVDKRLPTEAEWEKAAVGPEGYTWAFGNTFDGSKVNFCDQNCTLSWKDKDANDRFPFTAPVGSYESPNGYGLYDMSGNVWEWVQDWYDEQFYGKPVAAKPDPINQVEGEGRRVVRGGGWDNGAGFSRAAIPLQARTRRPGHRPRLPVCALATMIYYLLSNNLSALSVPRRYFVVNKYLLFFVAPEKCSEQFTICSCCVREM